MLEPVIIVETPFIIPNNNDNSRDNLKNLVKDPARFRMRPN